MNTFQHLVFGQHALPSFNHLLEQGMGEDIVILADSGSSRHCLPLFLEKVPVAAKAKVIVIPEGDENKNISTLSEIWDVLLNAGGSRSTVFINLGGGMVSDMGGFAAGTFNRGIPYYNIPTTLLSMVDAAIGGKCGINIQHVKNKAGLFYMPEAVYIDPIFLLTLPERHFVSGLAEALKTLLVADAEQWLWFENDFDNSSESINCLIREASALKYRIISEDFNDTGIRKCLNFGHTLGHALETLMMEQQKPVTHGEAVAAGMLMESFISKQLAGLNLDVFMRICSCINRWFQPIPIAENDIPQIISISRSDKKNAYGNFYLSLLHSPGNPMIDCPCDEGLLAEAVNFYRELYD